MSNDDWKMYTIREQTEWALVEIKWLDAFDAPSGWHDSSEYTPTDVVVTSVGRIWKHCIANYITLVGTVMESEMPNLERVSNVMHIPKGMIISVKPLLLGEYNIPKGEDDE